MNFLKTIFGPSNLPQDSLNSGNSVDCVSKTCVSIHTGVAETPGRRRVFSTADGKNFYVADNDFSNFSAIRTLFDDAGPCVAGSPDSILNLPVFITSDILDKLVLLARCRNANGGFNSEKVDALLENAAAVELLKMVDACIYLDARHLARECARRVAILIEGKNTVEMRTHLELPKDPPLTNEMNEELNKISRFVQ
ncbi:unnamed protein product [Cylicocyclus nassatus]|uniref:Uncharacterized protein n=1 Tax=Cylicocyclus nassatus TaxID=53992 RepID=A0AA36HA55_CYLNA|nr:unnamed protein product [Cylicocyclus nassatus]